MDFLTLVSEVGFPIAGAIAAGVFVFVTLKFILAGVTGSVTTLKNIIGQLDNRVQTMNNDLVKIDALLSDPRRFLSVGLQDNAYSHLLCVQTGFHLQ